jgi:hypothetical protein
MRTHILAVLAALLLLLTLGAGSAAAGEPTPTAGGPLQIAGQQAGSSQTATSSASTTQTAPSNRNVDVRIFSPGTSGGTTQSNVAGAGAAAGNANQTTQSAPQTQSGAGTQAAGQSAKSQQSAGAASDVVQVKPTNDNISVRIGSPGSDGRVEQTNAAGAGAAAGNENTTDQSASQGGSGSGTQAVGQDADNKQSANAAAGVEQIKPSNRNISVRIGSPGSNGPVEQTNAAGALALAGNADDTKQSAGQGSGGGAACRCGGGGGGLQAAGQHASNEQSANADAHAEQIHPSNDNVAVRIGSPGSNGPVEQTNAAGALGLAGNANDTTQSAGQSGGGGCGCGGGGLQLAGQDAAGSQSATADSTARQIHPRNDNTSVRIGSPGDDGGVQQSNLALAGALAGNTNSTGQSVTQSQDGAGEGCRCHGGIQAAGQSADSEQSAAAAAQTEQKAPSNASTPVAIGGADGRGCGCGGAKSAPEGGGGGVAQSNVADSLGVALNGNSTAQAVDQSGAGGGSKCGCGGGLQAAGQQARNGQSASAGSAAAQFAPSNASAPAGIGGGAGGGPVAQLNAALSRAAAGNANGTTQSVGQSGGGIQAVGQSAENGQSARAGSDAMQDRPSNAGAPVAIGGDHGCGCDRRRELAAAQAHGGGVAQANLAASLGIATNANATDQSVGQSQGGSPCGCHGGGAIQAAGQFAWNGQDADAASDAQQHGAANAAGPAGIGSGGYGSVLQANLALAAASAGNWNDTRQEVGQTA